ncbi:MAG: glycosyltransferase [Terrimicrobiaceae bacterium]
MKKAVGIAVAGIGVFSAAFYLVTALLLRRWLGGKPAAGSHLENPKPAPAAQRPPDRPEPVTFFRPIKSGEARLRDHLAVFLSALEPGDQVIFCATTPEDLRLCEDLAAGHPGPDISFLLAVEGVHRNPKINKLAQMEPLATRERWVVLDSDAVPDRRFLRAFRSEWQSKDADAISAPYAPQPAPGTPSRLDALGTGMALWPGVALLRSVGRLDFLTGACMGVKARTLQRLGGWKILGGSLADDHELGLLISRAGGAVGISDSVIDIETPDLTWKEWILHQHRASVTFRLCNPAGCLGIPLTHGVGLSFLFILLNPLAHGSWLLHLGLLALRAHSANSLPGPRGKLREIWLVSLLEPLFWLLSWLPLPVWWGGRWIRPGKLGS